MSYAGLGQVSSGAPIQVGVLAQRDPVVAFSSVMASDLLKQASVRPAGKRLGWLRGELNKVEPGLGDTFVSKTRELKRRGRRPNQAVFDALRLTLANQVATGLEKRVKGGALSGLGSSAEDINAVFCGITGVATAGGAIASSFSNPSGSAAVGQAGSAALQASGCNASALAQQARIAEANAAQAQAQAMALAQAQAQTQDNTMTYVAIGGGVLLLGLVGVVALKKR